MSLSLYSYYRSSCAYRVRIALNLKGIDYKIIPVNLMKEGGEQKSPSFTQLNPMQQVPYLDIGGGRGLAQSNAIIHFLEETYPQISLFPKDPFQRALVRQISEMIGSGIQPIQNIGVTNELKSRFSRSDQDMTQWNHDWIKKGLKAVETLLSQSSGKLFCIGDQVTVADCFLIPQVFNARRFNVDLSTYPHILRIDEQCNQLRAFIDAHPEKQPDCPPKS